MGRGRGPTLEAKLRRPEKELAEVKHSGRSRRSGVPLHCASGFRVQGRRCLLLAPDVVGDAAVAAAGSLVAGRQRRPFTPALCQGERVADAEQAHRALLARLTLSLRWSSRLPDPFVRVVLRGLVQGARSVA